MMLSVFICTVYYIRRYHINKFSYNRNQVDFISDCKQKNKRTIKDSVDRKKER